MLLLPDLFDLDNDKDLILESLGNNLIDNEELNYYPVGSAIGGKQNVPQLLEKCDPLFDV